MCVLENIKKNHCLWEEKERERLIRICRSAIFETIILKKNFVYWKEIRQGARRRMERKGNGKRDEPFHVDAQLSRDDNKFLKARYSRAFDRGYATFSNRATDQDSIG